MENHHAVHQVLPGSQSCMQLASHIICSLKDSLVLSLRLPIHTWYPRVTDSPSLQEL